MLPNFRIQYPDDARHFAVLGAIAILAWFFILRALLQSELAGAVAAAILSTDFTFLWCAADGRMDMMCIGLGSAAIAVFATYRRRSFRRALFFANLLSAFALFTHPNGAIFCLALWIPLLWMDRRSLRLADLALCAIPYLAMAAAWGLYIAQRPDYFLAQFSANAGSRNTNRLLGLRRPLDAIRFEFWLRYMAHFGVRPTWAAPVPVRAILIPYFYLAGILGAGTVAIKHGAARLFPALAIGAFLFMAFFVGLKAQNYIELRHPVLCGMFRCGWRKAVIVGFLASHR